MEQTAADGAEAECGRGHPGVVGTSPSLVSPKDKRNHPSGQGAHVAWIPSPTVATDQPIVKGASDMRPVIPTGLVAVLLVTGAASLRAEEPFARAHPRLASWREMVHQRRADQSRHARRGPADERAHGERGLRGSPQAATSTRMPSPTASSPTCPTMPSSGVNAFTICLQGGMPGYEGAVNSAFEPDGSLRTSYLARVSPCHRGVRPRRAWWSSSAATTSDRTRCSPMTTAIRAGVVNVARWIRSRGFRNVVLEIANEFDHGGFDHRLIRSADGRDRTHSPGEEDGARICSSPPAAWATAATSMRWPRPPISS